MILFYLTTDDWQRSSLNSDDDPPHIRLIIVVQANEINLKMPFTVLRRPPGFSHASSVSESANKDPMSSRGTGVVISLKSLVHASIWPEHAGFTESVLQTVIHDISVSTYVNLKSTYLLRISYPLDANGRELNVSLLPRGGW